jgi:hypothetical protein
MSRAASGTALFSDQSRDRLTRGSAQPANVFAVSTERPERTVCTNWRNTFVRTSFSTAITDLAGIACAPAGGAKRLSKAVRHQNVVGAGGIDVGGAQHRIIVFEVEDAADASDVDARGG